MSYEKSWIVGPDGQRVEAERIPVSKADEVASDYLLADGTSISMRTVVMDVFRVPGRYDAEGNPLYVVKSKAVMSARSPENLRQREGE